MILCDRIAEVPPLLAESQQTIGCPDCEDRSRGTCSHLKITNVNTGKVAMESNNQSLERFDPAMSEEPMHGLWSSACEESIKRRIVQRTRGRIRLLQVDTIGSRIVIRGSAPSYYLKQLALRGACDVLGSASTNQIDFNVEVSGSP